jgi:hypothetical protein
MPNNPSLSESTRKIAEITSGPSAEMGSRGVPKQHRDSPIEVQARAAIAAVARLILGGQMPRPRLKPCLGAP